MKHCFIFIMVAVSGWFLPLSAQTLFREISYDEALKEAKATDKMVFIDCYTSWCGPCKMMAKEVFPQKEMGEYLNPKFISLKIDMEKGDGPALREKYDVNSFPTYLFLNADGKLIHRMLGYKPMTAFIKEAEAGLENSRLMILTGRYEAGERSSEFLEEYMKVLQENNMIGELQKLAAEYLKNKNAMDLINDGLAFRMFCDCITEQDDSIFRKMYAGYDLLVQHYGKQAEQKFYSVWKNYVYHFNQFEGKKVVSCDLEGLEEYAKVLEENQVKERDRIMTYARYFSMMVTGQWKDALRNVKVYAKLENMDDNELLEMCDALNGNVPEEEIHALAKKRMKVLSKQTDNASDSLLGYVYGHAYYSELQYLKLRYEFLLGKREINWNVNKE